MTELVGGCRGRFYVLYEQLECLGALLWLLTLVLPHVCDSLRQQARRCCSSCLTQQHQAEALQAGIKTPADPCSGVKGCDRAGEGAFGEAWKVRRRKDDALFCVKTYHADSMSEREKEDARNEVLLLCCLAQLGRWLCPARARAADSTWAQR